MNYMNIVKFNVKPQHVEDYLKSSREMPLFTGQIMGRLVQIGEHSFCSMGLWDSKAAMDAEMANMISYLDGIRHMLEEISPELGVTDAVSGSVIMENK